MYQSKLIQVLKSFTVEEFRDFKKFLNTPVFKAGPVVKNSLMLFKVIHTYYPKFEKSKLEKEVIFKRLYPDQTYKVGKLEKQMSTLFGLLEEFIVSQKSGTRNTLHQLLTLDAFYRSRSLTNLAEISVKKYQKVLKEKNRGDSAFFYDTFLLEKQISNHQARFLDAKRTLNLPEALENLDQYYIFEKLELTCQLMAINRFIYPVELKKSVVVLEQLKPLMDADFFNVPVVKLYYRAYLLLTVEDGIAEEVFLDFEKHLELYTESISEEQIVPLNTIIRNYCVSQYVKGVKGYLERSFYIYKDHLTKGFLYYNEKLPSFTLNNLVEIGLLMRQFDWVYKLINDHKDRITGTSTPDEEVRLSLANYYFHIANYDKTLDYLADNYENAYAKIKAKRIEVKVYYEMKHVLLNPKIDAFKIYIYRIPTKKITQKYKDGNRNFIDLLKQIHLPRTFQNEKRIQKLTDKIKDLKYITEKEWLFQKLEALR